MEELAPGLHRWTARHPAWEPGAEPGSPADWPPDVGCVVYRAPDALVLVDPLVDRWGPLDALVEGHGRPVVVLTTMRFHGRSRAEVAERYGAELRHAQRRAARRRAPDPDRGHGRDDGVTSRRRARSSPATGCSAIGAWRPAPVPRVVAAATSTGRSAGRGRAAGGARAAARAAGRVACSSRTATRCCATATRPSAPRSTGRPRRRRRSSASSRSGARRGSARAGSRGWR